MTTLIAASMKGSPKIAKDSAALKTFWREPQANILLVAIVNLRR